MALFPASSSKYTPYSTTETDTGEVWGDGKKIYRKYFYGTISTYDDSSSRRRFKILHGIANIDGIIRVKGYIKIGSSTIPYAFGSTDISGNLDIVSSMFATSEAVIVFLDKNSYPSTTQIYYSFAYDYTKAS